MTHPGAVVAVRDPAALDDVRILFAEYVAWLGVDLAGPGLAAELAGLPGRYGPPGGELLLARDGAGRAVGCAGIRALDLPGCCELKRLYVRAAGRGAGVGAWLVEAALHWGAAAGYARMLLDTLPTMVDAHALYRRLGFDEIPAYQPPHAPGTLFFARRLGPP